MSARCFGAVKKAIRALQKYYEHDIYTLKYQMPDFPYPRSYRSLSDPTVTHSFDYKRIVHEYGVQQVLQSGKLVFLGNCDGEDIVVTYVRQYFSARFCAQAEGFLGASWRLVYGGHGLRR